MGHEQVRDVLLDAIGGRVRALRLQVGMTVREFAERAALSPRFAHQLEAGEGNISIAGLARVAVALGCSLPELIPPASDDHSLRAETWRLLCDSSVDDLQDLQQWLEQRKGAESKARFIALIGLRGGEIDGWKAAGSPAEDGVCRTRQAR